LIPDKKEVSFVNEHKSNLELAAEITIALLGPNACPLNRPDIVAKFYRAIYKEIETCAQTPVQELD